MLCKIIVAVILCAIHTTNASYETLDHLDEHHHGNTINLGTVVGKHKLPPKIIRVTKTVAVKVPVPYPVKIPYHIPYPVPVAKPYPVEVPKYIKIKEQVPIHVPEKHYHEYSEEGGSDHGASSGYHNEQGNGHYQLGGYSEQYHDGYGHGHGQGHGQQAIGISEEAGGSDGYSGEESSDGYGSPQGQYSDRQLIYSNPRFGINAYYTKTGSPESGQASSSYQYEQNSETSSETHTGHGYVPTYNTDIPKEVLQLQQQKGNVEQEPVNSPQVYENHQQQYQENVESQQYQYPVQQQQQQQHYATASGYQQSAGGLEQYRNY